MFAPLLVLIALSQTPPKSPAWRPMPLLSATAKAAGIFPGGEGGQWPRGLFISEADPRFLLLAIDVGGLYRSLDGGKTWQQSSAGWNARGANAFAIDPKDPRRVIGLGGNSMDWGETWGPNIPHGIYLSTDKAATWRSVQPLREGFGNSVAIDPSSFDPKRGYCTVAYVLSPLTGLWRSQDGGATWAKASEPPLMGRGEDGTALKLAVLPSKGVVLVGGKSGLWRSEDSGATFTQVHDRPVAGLTVRTKSQATVWISGEGGVLRSDDAGKTFAPLPAAGVVRGGKPVLNVAVSPAEANRLSCWVRGDNWQWVRYTSRDGGGSFAPIALLAHPGFVLPNNVRDGFFAWHPTDPEVVFGIGGDTVTKSVDGGKSFVWSGNGYNGIMLGGLFSFSAHAPKTVFLAFQDYNGAVTHDGGTTWSYQDVSGKGWGGQCYGGHAVDAKTMYYGDAESWNGPRRLRLTRDGGRTWSFVKGSDGKDLTFAGPDVSGSDPRDAKTLFASNLRSADGGATWSPMESCDGVYTTDGTSGRLLGKKGAMVVCSTDHGATWQALAVVPGGDIRDLAWDPVRQRLYVASQESLKRFEKGTWATISTPKDQYGNARVLTVAVDPRDPSVLYVGGSRDVYATTAAIARSADAGVTWKNLTTGDGPHEVNAIRVDPRTRAAWCNGQCYGMWRIAAPNAAERGPFVATVTPLAIPKEEKTR